MSGGQDWANEMLRECEQLTTYDQLRVQLDAARESLADCQAERDKLRERIKHLEKIEAAAKACIDQQKACGETYARFVRESPCCAFTRLWSFVYPEETNAKPTPPPKPEFTRLFRNAAGDLVWTESDGLARNNNRYGAEYGDEELDPTTMEPLR